jgi:hypothetical protein
VLPNSLKPEATSDAAPQDVFGHLSDDQSESAPNHSQGLDTVKEYKGKNEGKGTQGQMPGIADLKAHWGVETTEEKDERHHREWEELRRTVEARVFRDEQDKMRRRDKIRADNREHAQRHRDAVREKKIESGWVPGQKRVSCHILS